MGQARKKTQNSMEPANDLPQRDERELPQWDEAKLARLRRELLRFALLQLRNREAAEDVVQEAIAAALAASKGFEHRSSVKTWVFNILKNKIIDALRDRWNKDRVELAEEVADDNDFDALFTGHERWKREDLPSAWGDPERTLENRQFWHVFEICMTRMSESAARVFTMREFLGLEVDDICKELGISSSNCWVILHRARMSLRLCLQQRWFEKGEKT